MVRRWTFFLGAVMVLVFSVGALPVQARGEAGTTKRYPPSNTGNIYSNSKLPACQRSFDPYKVPRSFLKKCRVKIWPLKAVKPLPGGGKDYIYYVHGYETILTVPPKGLNTCNATNKQIAEYNLPPRSPGLTSGKAKCRSFGVAKPPPYLVDTTLTEPGMMGPMGSTDTMTSSTGASTSQAGITSSTMSNPAAIPDTGGLFFLPYAAALFMTAGVVTLLVLRRRVR